MRSQLLTTASLLSVALVLALAPSAHAGGYSVTACFGVENASWAEWEPTPGATAYTACPGGVLDVARPQSGEGMIARNVAGPGLARRGTTAAMTFEAPAGTSITGIDFDAMLLANPGWSAGVFDATRGAWLWCGARCSTSAGLWIHRELRGLATHRIQALVRCDAARCRRDVRRAFIALRHARVHLADGSAPSLGGVRGALGAGSSWLRGRADVAFDARDNSGIRLGRVELDGRVVHEDIRPCDFTRRIPCSGGTTRMLLDTRAWADGAHTLRLGAMDAAGNWTRATRAVRVDNTPPAEPTFVVQGGSDWSPDRTRTLSGPSPGGQAAPLVRARVRLCRAGGRCADAAAALARPRAATVAVSVTAFDGPGEYSARLALEDAAGNVGPYGAPLPFRFDDTRPGAPDLSAADRWHDGTGTLPLAAEGQPPVSGIRGFRVRVGGREALVATGLPLVDLPEGGTPIEVRAVSGAGVQSTAVRTVIRLDRTRPTVGATGIPSPDAWSRVPVHIAVRARDQAGLSGVRSLGWTVGAGAEELRHDDEATFELAVDGRHSVGYRAVDAAGNSSAVQTAAIRIDRTPPETVAFEAPDAADPALVRVVVADATSGVAGGRIELRHTGGGWRRVATSLDGGRLVSRLDDAALRAGGYELRAVVRDVAGNETVGTRRIDGAPATLTLPLRRRTTITLDRSGRTLRARLTAGGRPLGTRPLRLTERLRGRTTWRTVCARRTVVIARTLRQRVGVGATRHAAVAGGGCTLRTDPSGRVEVRLPRGPSRVVRVSFAGDPLLLPTSGSARLETPAHARLHASPRTVHAGGAVRFSGRLLSGHVPRAGKLVELQALVGAGWRTFATVRTSPRGTLRHMHRFAAASGGRTYWFRLRVPRETGYPFEPSATRAIAVRVI
jgi:hypothetical protein